MYSYETIISVCNWCSRSRIQVIEDRIAQILECLEVLVPAGEPLTPVSNPMRRTSSDTETICDTHDDHGSGNDETLER